MIRTERNGAINATPTLDEARDWLRRARAGEDVTPALIASLEGIQAIGTKERWAVEGAIRLALFASPARESIERVLQDALPYRVKGQLRGLIVRPGDEVGKPFAANPWGIQPTSTLDEAITQIWAGVSDRAPAFIAELRRRLLGLALFEDDSGAPFLAYLIYHEFDEGEVPEELADAPRPPFDRRHALDWEPFGVVSMFVGFAPTANPVARDGVILPKPLRELYAVHAGMEDGMWWLFGPKDVMLWSEMLGHGTPQPVATDDESETRLSSQLLAVFTYGDDRGDLFDLAGDQDDPPVRLWADGSLSDDPGQPFWAWFEDTTDLLLQTADEDW